MNGLTIKLEFRASVVSTDEVSLAQDGRIAVDACAVAEARLAASEGAGGAVIVVVVIIVVFHNPADFGVEW